MRRRYCVEIADGPSPWCCFAYFDTADGLARLLFDYEKIEVETEDEFGAEGDPFVIVLCRVARKDREGFLKAIDILPSLMDYAGVKGYDAFCLGFLERAGRVPAARGADRITLLQ